jgi:cytochrome o ubiquinol oxidase operon protein cyoD
LLFPAALGGCNEGVLDPQGRPIHGRLFDGSGAVTETNYDSASGGTSNLTQAPSAAPPGAFIYTIGFLLAVILTATSFWAANTSLLWTPGISLGLAVLAIAQIGVHLVFFLHITTGPDNTNNVLALAFGLLIVTLVVAGSLWIMTNLNGNMAPMTELMNLQMQH